MSVDTTGCRMKRAAPEELGVVSEILLEAAVWLRERGEGMWTEEDLTPDALRADVEAGRFHLARLEGGPEPVGVLRLSTHDPLFWPEAAAGEALYVHRLAVRRGFAGRGISHAILFWVAAHARALGLRHVRLDCEASRAALRRVYEDFGFSHHSDHVLGSWTMARYQLALPRTNSRASPAARR